MKVIESAVSVISSEYVELFLEDQSNMTKTGRGRLPILVAHRNPLGFIDFEFIKI